MCLLTRPEYVRAFLEKYKGREEIRVYKHCMCCTYDKLRSVWYPYFWKIGENRGSTRRKNIPVMKHVVLNAGFFVYLHNKESTLEIPNMVQVSFYANVADLIGANVAQTEAVFTKLRLTEYSYKKAIRDGKKRLEGFEKEWKRSADNVRKQQCSLN